ncbi:Succinyl-diaminopimelate desuccinylase [Nocardioides aquaticus]|uniref:Succinyl-diaminopimelate desuccinylase n=4 Tax=Actinomycetes TaxID=1760 RepID=A0ABX8EPT1_9ACTN|nr:M20/M25/M40 family metallo-hydrolase [Nocardioides aquaticus]QVT81826.1 Succinyl-diaminopimelate desuccinylase [Nocardioides aquaticus]
MTSDPVEVLRRLVRHATVSHRDPDQDDVAAFEGQHATLAEAFPLVHEHLERTRVGRHGLLLRWPGSDPAADPVVLMAHQDVVPVADPAAWSHPPFGGDLGPGADGEEAVWGRGTLDDKGPLVAVWAAVEALLEQGHVPARDVWLSSGADEEVAGTDAHEAVAELRRRGVTPWFVVDEGGAVAGGAFPGVAAPLAVIGVGEKGTTRLELVARGAGGHASTPARGGPTARIARAVVRLDRASMPPRLPSPTVELFRRLRPHASAPLRAALRPLLADARLRPVLTRLLLAAGPETAAMARTTVAVTTLSGSPAHNVVAATATAGLDVRVMAGDTVDDAVAHVRRTIRDDDVEVRVVEAGGPSPLSPYDDPAFALLERTTAAIFPEAVPTPYLMMAATDARHFHAICERVYRFTPLRMSKAQRESIHAHDEHLGTAALRAGVAWWTRLLEDLP